LVSCRPIISPFASWSVARQGEPISSRDVPGGAGRAMVLGRGQPWRRTDRRRQGRIYTAPDKSSAALSASKPQVDFLRQASCNRQKIAVLCSKRHLARMHRKPHRHPRESGDLCRMGPRFRGDDDPLWRLLHNAGRSRRSVSFHASRALPWVADRANAGPKHHSSLARCREEEPDGVASLCSANSPVIPSCRGPVVRNEEIAASLASGQRRRGSAATA
jgi:hypothetical protein